MCCFTLLAISVEMIDMINYINLVFLPFFLGNAAQVEIEDLDVRLAETESRIGNVLVIVDQEVAIAQVPKTGKEEVGIEKADLRMIEMEETLEKVRRSQVVRIVIVKNRIQIPPQMRKVRKSCFWL